MQVQSDSHYRLRAAGKLHASNASGGGPILGREENTFMGEVVDFHARKSRSGDKRRLRRDDYVRGQQVLANAIFHWKSDPEVDARAGVRFLLHHLATAFRSDDAPLQPRPVGTQAESEPN
ncbi:MAG: hypothetical protein ACRD1E_08015 [Terriglobales bacterium]